MSLKFGKFNPGEIVFEEEVFHKNQTLTSGSVGVTHHLAKKDDYLDGTAPPEGSGLLSESGSHWAFVHNMFFMSGSDKVNSDETPKFDNIFNNFNESNDLKPFYKNKFYSTASIFYIPQQYFGDRIKPGSFTLTARTGSDTNTTKQIKIIDDNNGNLYSNNNYDSRSSTNAQSSSDNYVGNIFYDLGLVILTETASWSGSTDGGDAINYLDIGGKEYSNSHIRKDYRYWNLKFKTTTSIFTTQYSVKINSGDFNKSTNSTTRKTASGSLPVGTDLTEYSNIKSELTGSGFRPYFNQIQLYREVTEEPALIANLPRAIQMRDDIDLIITFRVDH